MPRMFPITIVESVMLLGNSEISKTPSAKNVVYTMPITASSRILVRFFIKPIARAASIPLINAPTENGMPIMYATATPGTTACDKASPSSDQPLSTTKHESSAHTPPIKPLTRIAFTMYSY